MTFSKSCFSDNFVFQLSEHITSVKVLHTVTRVLKF